jgi:hypothetical protein
MPRIHVDRPPTYRVEPDDVAEPARVAPAPADQEAPTAAQVEPAPDKATTGRARPRRPSGRATRKA